MRVVLLNSEDLRGGAARAVYRLHLALRAAGVQSTLRVQVKHGHDSSVVGPRRRLLSKLRTAADLLPIVPWWLRKRGIFYPGWLPDSVSGDVQAIRPNLLHLHWITGGFVNVGSLRGFGLPLVWTLHDMWAFTGGCHYDNDCGRYDKGCGRCPVLGSNMLRDPSWFGFRRKARAYRGLPIWIVAPSRWLAERASASTLLSPLSVRVIPNAIDTAVFHPADKQRARALLHLPAEARIILFGAVGATSDPRKGYRFLQPALKRFSESWRGQPVIAVVLGATTPKSMPDYGMPCRYIGSISDDETLARLYSAADVLIAPSTQENLSNMVLEALACGTPVVAFRIGGMPDMIEHKRNGYLAEPFEPADLAHGLCWTLEHESRRVALSARARAKVSEEFEASKIAQKHLELYEEILSSSPRTGTWGQ